MQPTQMKCKTCSGDGWIAAILMMDPHTGRTITAITDNSVASGMPVRAVKVKCKYCKGTGIVPRKGNLRRSKL